ncbi:MAG: diacylglycerol/lipid kinase family protein [Bacteroidales bacterium]
MTKRANDKTIYLFVVNPISGGIDKQMILDFILERSKSEGFIFELLKTTGENDEQEILSLVEKHDPEVVVAVGGDGTLMMLARLFREKDQHIALIPSGSANGMAVELDIPQVKGLTEAAQRENLEQCWELISRGRVKSIDLVRVNDRYSLHLSDAGLNARIVKGYDEDDRRGLLGYAKQILKEAPEQEQFKYRIKTEKKSFTGKAYMIVMANARRYGTGAIINQKGRLDDGMVELCIVKSLNLMMLINAITSIITDDPAYNPDDLEVISCRKAEISFMKDQLLQVDGEFVGETGKIDLEVVPKAVQIRC